MKGRVSEDVELLLNQNAPGGKPRNLGNRGCTRGDFYVDR